MRHLVLAAVLTATLAASPARAAGSADSSCTFTFPNTFSLSIAPDHPCVGESVFLKVTNCGPCNHLVSGNATADGSIYLDFRATQVCPISLCAPESLTIPLGVFDGGFKILTVYSTSVTGDSTAPCYAHDQRTFSFSVDTCAGVGPVPGPLPFATVTIDHPPCVGCPPTLCPGDSIPVTVAMLFPNSCYRFRGIEILPTPADPIVHAPVLRILVGVNDCLRLPCVDGPFARIVNLELPPLPVGHYSLPVTEVWTSLCDSSRVDSVFSASFPFSVSDSCAVVSPGCFLVNFVRGGDRCDAVVDRTHSGTVSLAVTNSTPLAGLQGVLAFDGPGLQITNVEPTGPAATWKVAWTPIAGGAKFVIFSTDGSLIPPSIDLGNPPTVLRVTVASILRQTPAAVTLLGVDALQAADSLGHGVPLCPTLVAVRPVARICTGPAGCDINGDGVGDVRDLVLMVHCILGFGSCPDTSLADLDCDGNGTTNLDDIFCCARTILFGNLPDSLAVRPEPTVGFTLGAPLRTAAGFDVPLELGGADRVGAAKLALTFPSDRFTVTGLELPASASSWLSLYNAGEGPDAPPSDHASLLIGLIELGHSSGPSLGATLHLALKPGASPGGELRLTGGDFSGPDGAGLKVSLAPLSVPVGPPLRLALSAPMPNPFSASTRFTLSLPRAGDVDVSVHDLSGRRVATILHGRFDAGSRDVVWGGTRDDGARLRDGVYFVRVTAPGGDSARKVILLHGN